LGEFHLYAQENMKSNWNTSGLILEGICGTGKSTLLQALLNSKNYCEKSFLSSLVLSEHQTQRVLERKEQEVGLNVADNIALLDYHISYLESLKARLEYMPWRQSNRTNMRFPFIFERFHFTHVYHYQHMSWEDVEDIDSRLVHLNCKICLLTMSISQFRDRIINSRDAGWRDYLKRYGNTDEEILDYYEKQQDFYQYLCKKSKLKTFIINTTKMSVEDTVEQVLDYWGIIRE
jgi:thymidylate kinase